MPRTSKNKTVAKEVTMKDACTDPVKATEDAVSAAMAEIGAPDQVANNVVEAIMNWKNLPQTNGVFKLDRYGDEYPFSITDASHIVESGMARFVADRLEDIEAYLKDREDG